MIPTELLTMRPPGPMRDGLSKFIASLPKNCVMVEVGCYRGEASVMFAAAAATVYCVDPWRDYTELNPEGAFEMTGLARAEADFDNAVRGWPNIIKWKMTSADAVRQFLVNELDCVYLDGDHGREAVAADIMRWRTRIKKGGILSGHDYGRKSGVTAAVRELLGEPEAMYEDSTWAFTVAS